MFKLTFFVTICIAVLSQNLASSDLKDSRDEVIKLFHEMMEAIDKVLTQAQNALNNAMDQVQSKATELENKAKSELDKVLAPLREKLNDLIEKAKAIGFDVSECQSYVDKFSSIPDDLVDNLVNCINTQISIAQGYVNDALNNAKKIEQDLNNIDKDIDNCQGNKFEEIECYAKIIEKIVKETKEAPQQIIEDVAKVTALVTEIIPVLEQCFTNQIANAGKDATKDIEDFAVCVGLPF